MIFIVGAHATGKTYLANAISKFNFARIDLGPILLTLYKKSGNKESFSQWIQDGENKNRAAVCSVFIFSSLPIPEI